MQPGYTRSPLAMHLISGLWGWGGGTQGDRDLRWPFPCWGRAYHLTGHLESLLGGGQAWGEHGQQQQDLGAHGSV